ncbi:MAG: hypothetical protein KBH45_16815 [Verrucomicrobia bacterium]|nr:hypothetical protein [Verrucomicrobiota bacterium]
MAAIAKKRLAGEGYDPQCGTLSLKRAIQEPRLHPLATQLLVGDLSRLGNGERNSATPKAREVRASWREGVNSSRVKRSKSLRRKGRWLSTRNRIEPQRRGDAESRPSFRKVTEASTLV